MDHFGIGAGVRGSVLTYMQGARRTGRTTSLVESLKNGDRVFFCDRSESERVKRLCNERGIDVDCRVLQPSEAHRVFEFGTPQGRTLFDHSWIEQYYLAEIEKTMGYIDHLQRESSGWGIAHIETRLAAAEVSKWTA